MRKKRDEQSFWVSYSDLASGLMIVFLLVMVAMVVEQKDEVIKQQDAVEKMVKSIQVILGTRNKLSESINIAFADEDGKISADPITAQLTLDEGKVVFAQNKAELTEASKLFLEDFTPRYLCALLSEEHKLCTEDPGCSEVMGRIDPESPNRVRRILVTGHADLFGSSYLNHNLSARRAESVVGYMFHILQCAASSQPDGDWYRSCPEQTEWACSADQAWSYAQERLYAVGAGNIEHCTELISDNEGASCWDTERADIAGIEQLEQDPKKRKVTFELELTGSDFSGILMNIATLQSELNLENTDIEELVEKVRTGCKEDSKKYDSCIDYLESP